MSEQSVIERRIDWTRWSFLQWAVLVIGAVHIVWAIAGWVAEPRFELGEHAPATPVLGMDYNGWHAVAGLLLFGPALIVATCKSWSAWYCVLTGVGGGFAVGVWALFSHHVLIFSFPNHITDAIEHMATGATLLAIVAVQVVRDGGMRPVFGLSGQ